MDRPFWQSLVDEGHNLEIFRDLDLLGEEEVRRRLPTYGDMWSIHAQLWLRELAALKEAKREAERAADLAIQQRAAQANERGADAADRAAKAAERAATAAEESAREARRYRKIAFFAAVISLLALIISAVAIAGRST